MIGLSADEHVATGLMGEDSVGSGCASHVLCKFKSCRARKIDVVNCQLPAAEPDGLSSQARINDPRFCGERQG